MKDEQTFGLGAQRHELLEEWRSYFFQVDSLVGQIALTYQPRNSERTAHHEEA